MSSPQDYLKTSLYNVSSALLYLGGTRLSHRGSWKRWSLDLSVSREKWREAQAAG